jgi:hypothetical protein
MKILIIGHSDIAKRKVIPAIDKIPEIKSFDLASTSNTKINSAKVENLYDNYSAALINSDAEVAYISLPNSMHYKYSKIALQRKKNVIVDKPAIIKKWQLANLYNLAKDQKLAISMSCVFHHHKAWEKFKKVSDSTGHKGLLIASFTIPKLHKNNIRMSKRLAGGAINDLGIYASSVGYLFFKKKMKNIAINSHKENGLIMGFTVSANYGNGEDFIGNFGFNKLYMNEIEFHGADFITSYNRVFSPPSDLETKVIKKTKNKSKEYLTGKDDSFLNYFNDFICRLESNKASIRNEFYQINSEYLNYLN